MSRLPPSRLRRSTRGRPGTIDRLPRDLKAELNAALRGGHLTQREITDHLNALLCDRGSKPVSISAVNRYATKVEEKAALFRDAREAAAAIVGKLGEQADSDLGRCLTEFVKTLALDCVTRIDTGQAAVPLDDLKALAIIVERAEKASKLGADRELKIREKIQAEAAGKLDKAVASGRIEAEAAEEARRILGFEG